ncbi:unnamed protein product [Timema podura]|uniref:Uncharacterized protein n=1 Tax=Timema podura TaxID=61482 RepID=A0ABN7NPR6_TIMPD|nr:unnamed protein product [Timema podura]
MAYRHPNGTTELHFEELILDQFECEIELLMAGKKKRLDKDKQDRVEELKTKHLLSARQVFDSELMRSGGEEHLKLGGELREYSSFF